MKILSKIYYALLAIAVAVLGIALLAESALSGDLQSTMKAILDWRFLLLFACGGIAVGLVLLLLKRLDLPLRTDNAHESYWEFIGCIIFLVGGLLFGLVMWFSQ